MIRASSMNVENFLESKLREIESRWDVDFVEYQHLYKSVANQRLKKIFSWLHREYINLFTYLNKRLPTYNSEAHFWAAQSRELIFVINLTNTLQKELEKSPFAFRVDEYYEAIIKKCRSL